MRPGEVEFAQPPIVINAGRPVVTLHVRNASAHVVRVSSHYHFYEVNRRLEFDRAAAYGRRLDVPAGRSVRFAPGEERDVNLVPYAGLGVPRGFRGVPAPPPGRA
jgi:urease subunit beta